MEASHFSIASNEAIQRFYQRKCSKGPKVVAMKAVAHKLARASYNMLKDGVEFDVKLAFSGVRHSTDDAVLGLAEPEI